MTEARHKTCTHSIRPHWPCKRSFGGVGFTFQQTAKLACQPNVHRETVRLGGVRRNGNTCHKKLQNLPAHCERETPVPECGTVKRTVHFTQDRQCTNAAMTTKGLPYKRERKRSRRCLCVCVNFEKTRLSRSAAAVKMRPPSVRTGPP